MAWAVAGSSAAHKTSALDWSIVGNPEGQATLSGQGRATTPPYSRLDYVTYRIRIDFRFVEVEYELWAVEHALNELEPAIAHLSEVAESETLAELRRSGWKHDPAEVDLALQDIRELRD